MNIPFVKYQGTGNDFVIIDNRELTIPSLDVAAICHRRFGVGADGLMLLQNKEGFDFEMVYYNSDGNLSSMCGNGGRCIVHFANSLGLGKNNQFHFIAVDGPHHATVEQDIVSLEMIPVTHFEKRGDNVVILNTGSPHYIQFIDTLPEKYPLIEFAKSIRYGDEFQKNGINVNIVYPDQNGELHMRTYERGVEDETYSCGTGVTAAVLAYDILRNTNKQLVRVQTPGGSLSVSFQKQGNEYRDIILTGPAVPVFEGKLSI